MYRKTIYYASFNYYKVAAIGIYIYTYIYIHECFMQKIYTHNFLHEILLHICVCCSFVWLILYGQLKMKVYYMYLRKVLCIKRRVWYCHSLHRLSVRPTFVTTLQPTIFNRSYSYLVQPLTLVGAWTLLIMFFMFISRTQCHFEILLIQRQTSWTRPAEGSHALVGIFSHDLRK